ncbi:hypothetical protein AC233_30875 [Burkholderia sp. HB1]|nr:hypothetical protein AC233_30875 [Burkholderia sp. HB1]
MVIVAALSEPIDTVAEKFFRLSVDRPSVAVTDCNEPGVTRPVEDVGAVAMRLLQARVPEAPMRAAS